MKLSFSGKKLAAIRLVYTFIKLCIFSYILYHAYDETGFYTMLIFAWLFMTMIWSVAELEIHRAFSEEKGNEDG